MSTPLNNYGTIQPPTTVADAAQIDMQRAFIAWSDGAKRMKIEGNRASSLQIQRYHSIPQYNTPLNIHGTFLPPTTMSYYNTPKQLQQGGEDYKDRQTTRYENQYLQTFYTTQWMEQQRIASMQVQWMEQQRMASMHNSFGQGSSINEGGKKRRASTAKWSPEEDADLRLAENVNPGNDGKQIDLHLREWSRKGPWAPDEDAMVVQLVEKYGQKKWSFIAQQLQGRSGNQCRARWHNHLSPDIKKGGWTDEEDTLIIDSQARLGNKWVEISKLLVGRSGNDIMNRWNNTLKKRVVENGGKTAYIAAKEAAKQMKSAERIAEAQRKRVEDAAAKQKRIETVVLVPIQNYRENIQSTLFSREDEIDEFYASGTVDIKGAYSSVKLAQKYREKFKSLSEDDRALLEKLNSSYDGILHKIKAGFRDVAIRCLEHELGQCDLYWYLRLVNDQYSIIPFIGYSSEDILMKKLQGFITRAKADDCISIVREKHLVAHRSVEDAIDMTARLFERLGTDREDSKKRAEDAFVKLSDMICYDTDDDDEGHEFVY